MRVLVGQLSPVVGDVRGNLARCVDAVRAARAAGCRLVVLPELVISGYPPRDLLERGDFLAACREASETLAGHSDDGLTIVFGTPWRDEAGLRNAAVVAHGGRVARVVAKTLLPTYDVFDEHRYFVPARDPRPVEVAGLRLGVTVCEDIWNLPDVLEAAGASHPAGRDADPDPVAAMAGCDLLINISASPFQAGKAALRRDLLARQARRVGAPAILANMVGGNDELLFDGNAMVVDAGGALLARGPAFEAAHLVVDTDGAPVADRDEPFESEIARALTMGVRDYAERCGFSRLLLGLSGGIDSAVVAVIAARALGPDRVLAVGMPGPYSSEGSVADSRRLAANLGIEFRVVPIGGVFEAYREALAPLSPERAGAARPDLAEENLQARTRGNLLMALSNRYGHLLLTTGNKSELAVGYATLYGDMSGGLAVIGDVFKTDVYRLARWLDRDGEVIPRAILDKPPSAELAPDQRDQDSLPPYEELDAILRLYVEGLVDPADIVARGHDPATVARVVRMVVRAEYKRWQAPPALRVSSKAFGTGRRLPLAQRWHVDPPLPPAADGTLGGGRS